MELTILMPCLNEAETLAICIRKAKTFLSENNIDGEVLISDNGSTDGSQDIARAEGARVVSTDIKGYGSALINGTKNAYGKYVIMGDADDSYDFLHLMPFVEKHRENMQLTHIDAVPDNFLFNSKGNIQLTDWEYAGMQDKHVDIAMFCIYAMYSKKQIDHI